MNLCSAYSYCLSVLGALYVWHGRGATEDERQVALTYGQSLATTPANVVEFEEGMEDEMFWMVLGDGDYANADHWQFRGQLDRLGARLHVIDSSQTKSLVGVFPVYYLSLLVDNTSLGAIPFQHFCPRSAR